MLLQIHEPGQTPAPHEEIERAVGIDLGTTNSLIAISHGEKPKIIPINSNDITPSVYSLNGHNISSIKRLMGKGYGEAKKYEHLFPLIPNDEGVVRLQIGDKILTPTEISAEILKQIKIGAEKKLGRAITKAVITVPAYFDEGARSATKDAALLAGIEPLRLIAEPTAAALAYGLDKQAEGTYAVFDLGGGTFDISILKMQGGIFQVIATGGDASLGGDDIDQIICDYAQSKGKKIPMQIARGIKEFLTDHEEYEGEISLNRGEFNQLCEKILSRCINLCAMTLSDADMEVSQIDGVIMVGGSTRIPYLRQKVQEFFGKEPLTDIDPDKVVALGAAIQAENLTHGGNSLLLDVIPLSLGVEMMGGIVEKIIWRNSPIPCAKAQEFTTYMDSQNAIQIHIVQGERELAGDCRSLANFTLAGIPPMAAGAARIQVTFKVDADGLLSVEAMEQTTGVKQHIEVKPSYGINEEEMREMLLKSMQEGRADMEKRMQIEAAVDAKRLIISLQNALESDGEIIDGDYRKMLFAKIDNMNKLLANEASRDEIHEAIHEIEKESAEFVEMRMNNTIAKALQGVAVDDEKWA